MAGTPFGAFPRNPYGPQNPTSLPNWMRRNLEAGEAARRRAEDLKRRLAQTTSPSKAKLTPQQWQDLRRHLTASQRKGVSLSAEGTRRLQATLHMARQTIARAGNPADRQTLTNLARWERFLEEASAPKQPGSPGGA